MDYEKIIIHDLPCGEFSKLSICQDGYLIISADVKAAHCQGCFGCWLKTPGKCAYKDGLKNIGAILAQSGEITIISKNCYGGYSPGIKKILDRAIAAMLPFFTYRNGETHHPLRYKARPACRVYFYGEISGFEKLTAIELAERNAVNMGWRAAKPCFVESPSDLAEAWR